MAVSAERKLPGRKFSISSPSRGKPMTYEIDVCLLLFHVLTTSKVIWGRVPTCYSVHSCRLNSAAPLGNHAISTITWYPTQSHSTDIKPTTPCTIPIMSTVWLGSNKYTFWNHWFDSSRVIMWLSGISSHGDDDLVSQWDSIVKSPWLHTVTTQYRPWYRLRCC